MLSMVLLLIVFSSLAFVRSDPIIVLPDGTQLKGKTEGTVSAFKGVRYAKPPVNSLRWAPPVPWVNADTSMIYDALDFGHNCKQVLWGDDGLFSSDHGNEDCLFLNVYVNLEAVKASNKSGPLPVGVFVHGGSYVTGSSSLPLYDGVDAVEFWKGQAIIVTTNYRLNVFGFLGSEELRSQDPISGSTGNQGIQDQRLAFDWVRRNIEAFGGDANRVTVFGESAGAGSMSNHLTMQRSWSLFHSLVAESGAFYEGSAQNMSNAEWTYQNLLQGTGCADLTCLLGKTTDEIFAVSTKLKPIDPTVYPNAFCPTADGVEATTHPWIALANGAVADVPVILGTNSDEGAIFTYVPHRIGEDALHEHWRRVDGYSTREIKQLDSLYVTGVTYPEGHATPYWYAAQRTTGDRVFSCPSKYAAQTLSGLASSASRASNTFMYHFEHHPRNANYTRHVSELEYVFHQGVAANILHAIS